MKLDLACGKRCAPGWVGVDISPDTDATIICDLSKRQWEFGGFIHEAGKFGNSLIGVFEPVPPIHRDSLLRFKSGTVHRVRCQHFFEHLTGVERINFMDELHRILVPGGKATIITPYYSSTRAIQDPTHCWPPVCEQSYLYFDRKWREDNLLGHYPIRCNFTFEYSYLMNPDVGFPDQDARSLGVLHYLNAVNDLEVMLTRCP